MLGRKKKSNTAIKTKDRTRKNKSEGTGDRKKIKKRNQDRIIQFRQNGAFQNNEKIFQQEDRECSKTYQEPYDKETKKK